MKHPELVKYADRADSAGIAARVQLANRRQSGDTVAVAAARYAQAEHAAMVIVAYTRHKGLALDDTGLIAVPPPPAGLHLPLPDGMEWPTGFTCGPLATDNERKVAAKAIAADLLEQRERVLNEFRCDKDAVELERDLVSVAQSMIRAETEEAKMDTYNGPPPERAYGAPVGSGRANPAPPPLRRR